MGLAAHRVRRQSWRVGVRSAQEAFAVRARLRTEVEHELRGAFERAFDEAAPDERIVHIPRLELRLRVASLGELADALAEAIGREIRLQQPHDPPREPQVERLHTLLDYLDSGGVAWHAAHVEAAALSASLGATLREALELAARRGPDGEPSFERAVQYYFRLLQLLPQTRWAEAAACIAEAQPAGAPDFKALSAYLVASPGAARLAADVAAAPSPQAIITALLAARPPLPQHEAYRIAAAVLAAARMPVSFARLVAPHRTHIPAARPGAHGPTMLGREPAAPLPAPSAPPQPHPKPQDDGLSADAPQGAPEIATVMAGNAGLVLLHPFLPRLFEVCGLLQKQRLQRTGAAALLHWLATGRDEVFEFELGFVKLLLGLRPESPLAVGEGLLGAREREEGEALLRSAIGHWKALGNTSVEGFRVSFLQRRGALRGEDAGWRLQLEPEPFDVLLRHLPWGLAMVKLPWMTRPLYTDWPTP